LHAKNKDSLNLIMCIEVSDVYSTRSR